MRCPRCEYENPAESKFCLDCGGRLGLKCLVCGAELIGEPKFCNACGAPVSVTNRANRHGSPGSYTPKHLAEKILTSRSALEGERKQVTVLFCDIANSTILATHLGAEGMHKLLNAFFDLALTEVHRYEGTINQFLGDGFMALFGAPVAHEDHARRALLSAIGIQRSLLRTGSGQVLLPALRDVGIRIGVNTGAVVVGKIGDNLRMDYTAIGDTTNLAARLQTDAKPGFVYASESTYAAGRPYFDFDRVGEHSLKGIQGPVVVYALTKVRARPEGVSRAKHLGIGSPLIGRDRDLALVEEEIGILSSREGGIVILTGEPGIGKSRLVAEIHRRVSPGSLLWLEGRAVSFGRNLSYWPFIEILKNCFAIQDDDAEEESWRKLERGVKALFFDATPELLPYLATVLALRVPTEYEDRVKYLDGQGLGRQVFLSMRRLVEQLARRQPVLLLLEDWHWADSSSVGLMEHLLPLTRTTRLLVCFVTRPDPEGPTARIRKFASENPGHRCHEITLSPLSEEQGAALVRNLVEKLDLPEMLLDLILRKTEGNPFFVEEVIRSLVADGVLARRSPDHPWHLARPVDHVNLPDTIEGLLLARIDRLDEELKRALKLASVIGRSFLARVLEAISEASREIETDLSELEHAELIRQKQRLPEVEYIFKHALVQEAAYGSILTEHRRSIHGRVAQAIEALFKDRLDEFTSLLAYHYTRAEDWEKAQEYLFKAGDQAGRMAADAEALEHFRQAESAYLKAFGDTLTPLQQASLARKIGAALFGTGHYEQAHEQFRRALQRLGFHYPTSRWGIRRAILKYLAAHFSWRLREHVGMPMKAALGGALAQEVSTVCQLMTWMDYYLDQERMILDGLLELYAGERGKYAIAKSIGLSALGMIFMFSGAKRLARRYDTEAVAIAEATHNPSALGLAYFSLGWLDSSDGRFAEAHANLKKSATAYREAGDLHSWGAPTLFLSQWVLCLLGDVASARALALEIVRMSEDTGDPQLASWGCLCLGHAALTCDPLHDTSIKLYKARDLALKIPAYGNAAVAVGLLGKCWIRQGRLADALALLNEGTQLVQSKKLPPLESGDILNGLSEALLAFAERSDGPTRRTTINDAKQVCRRALRCAHLSVTYMPEALRLTGTLAWLRGNGRRAQELWQQSMALAEKFAFPIERGRTLLEMGTRLRDPSVVRDAVETLSKVGAAVYLASALHSLAQLLALSADAASALPAYDHAIAALEEVQADYELATACTECARLQEQVGQFEKARVNVEKASELFNAVGVRT